MSLEAVKVSLVASLLEAAESLVAAAQSLEPAVVSRLDSPTDSPRPESRLDWVKGRGVELPDWVRGRGVVSRLELPRLLPRPLEREGLKEGVCPGSAPEESPGASRRREVVEEEG